MKVWIYLLLFLLGFGVVIALAAIQSTPGYMDSDYYFAGGLQLARGEGFWEEFIWNYLDDPGEIPHPSHGYWMPMISVITWLGMKFSSDTTFSGSRYVFLILAGMIPPMTAWLCYSLSNQKSVSILAGLIAVFSSFYLPYMGTTDTFAVYMVLGILWLQVAGWHHFSYNLQKQREIVISTLLLGVIAGVMHLTRVDGVLWLVMGFILLVYEGLMGKVTLGKVTNKENRIAGLFGRSIILLVGYLIIMSPWMLRNLGVFGTLLAPGGVKSLWFVQYNDLYAFPVTLVTPARWWQNGVDEILRARLWALGQNLQTVLAIHGQIFLMPLIILGLWQKRTDIRVKLGVVAWVLSLGIMTIVFPFAGARGGFFHSAAAIQPLFWAMAPVGLEVLVDWGRVRRGWNIKQARRTFTVGILLILMFVSGFIIKQRVIGADWGDPVWSYSSKHYSEIESALTDLGAQDGEVVLVNNPPGYWLATSRPAIVIPDGSIAEINTVARRYNGKFLLLEPNHPDGLKGLFDEPVDMDAVEYLQTVDGTHIFRIDSQ